jgi:hypothetical protein
LGGDLSAFPIDHDELSPPPEGDLAPVKPVTPVIPVAEPLDWPKLAPLSPPDRKWAIKGWIGFGHVTLLVGPGGIGKTLLAQQMASCLALGRPFIEAIERPHKCLMWACEDDHDELWRRQLAISRWCKAGLEEFHENLTIIPRHGLDNALADNVFGKLTFTPLIAKLTEQASDLDAEVVILDNVGQIYGGSENDRHSVTSFLNALSGALAGKAIMLLAHPSRGFNSEFSGSSAWENVARTRLYFGSTLPGAKPTDEADPVDDVRYLSRRKANYSPKDYRRMTYADGALTPDVPEILDGGIVGQIKGENARRAILEAIPKIIEMGLHSSDGQRSPNFLPKMMAEYKIDNGLQSRELTAAMRQLMTEGKLKRDTVGRSNNRNAIKGLIVVA